MRKKIVVRMLCLAMAASMIGTMVPTSLYPVTAKAAEANQDMEASDQNEDQIAVQAELEDGVNDEWTLENKVGDDAVCAVEDEWLHLKSGVGNGNNPGSKPAMFVNPTTFDFSKDGYFDFTIKTDATEATNNRFGVYLGYNTDSVGMMIGFDAGGWFWQKYGASGSPWYTGDRIASPTSGEEVNVHIEWTAAKKVTVKIGDTVAFQNEDFSEIGSLGNKIAFKCGSYGGNATDVFVKNIHYTGQKTVDQIKTFAVSGKVVDAEGKPIANATVAVGKQSTKTNEDGVYSINVKPGQYQLSVIRDGYVSTTQDVTVGEQNVNVENIVLTQEAQLETETLSTEDMDVVVSKTFPSVVRYDMKKGDLAGKVFYGQSEKINTVTINGTAVELDDADVKATFDGAKATYVMTVKGDKIDAVITSELVAEGNTLAFNITDIKNNLEDTVDGNPIQTIEIPNQSLVSVRSSQNGANFKGASMSSNTKTSGDYYLEIKDNTTHNRDYAYGFVSNDEMSAGLWSNSEHDGYTASTTVSGGSHNTRVQATTQKKQDYVSLGLSSCAWYYHRVVTDSHSIML